MIPVILDEVTANGWMTEAQVMDVMALAEITPGSMGINCATFVGYRIDGIPCALLSSLGVMVPSTDTVHAGRPFLKTAERESLDGTCAVGDPPGLCRYAGRSGDNTERLHFSKRGIYHTVEPGHHWR